VLRLRPAAALAGPHLSRDKPKLAPGTATVARGLNRDGDEDEPVAAAPADNQRDVGTFRGRPEDLLVLFDASDAK
jgi:hypothetical protein